MNRDPAIWFPAKRYGYGWGLPVCWQGWVVLITYWVLFAAGLLTFTHWSHPAYIVLYGLGLSLVLIAICAWKGEPLRWRWGKG